MGPVHLAAAQGEVLFDPDDLAPEREARGLEGRGDGAREEARGHTYATSPPNSAKAARQSTRSSLATRPTAVRWRGSMRWRQAGSYATP